MTIQTGAKPLADEASPTSENENLEGQPLENADANPADSSDADEKGAKEPENLLSVVKSAVEKEPEAAASPPVKDEADKPAEAAEGDKPAEAEAKDADLPFHNHPRWKEMVAQRDTYREDAERYGNITTFMGEHGLSGEEVAEGFSVMAAIKSRDPEQLAKAREYFEGGLAQLDELLGNALPDDLRERVEAGELDEATAKETANARARANLAETRLKDRNDADTAKSERDQRVKLANDMVTASNGWEERQRKADPDFAKKASLVEQTVRAIVQREGKAPASPEEAVALLDRAKAEVDETVSKLVPTPRPVAPKPRSSSAPINAEPKTLRDAIAGALTGDR